MEIPGGQLVCYMQELVWYLKGPWGTVKKQAREKECTDVGIGSGSDGRPLESSPQGGDTG